MSKEVQAKSLKQLAQEAVTLSALMNGRDKVSTEEIIKAYPDGFTVAAVDMVETETESYPVLLMKEDDNVFYCGGVVLKKIVSSWIDSYGTADAVNAALSKEDIRIKLEETQTKDKKKSLTKAMIM